MQPTDVQTTRPADLSGSREALDRDHLVHDREGAFPWDKWEVIRASNLLRTPFGTEWGGLGLDLRSTMQALESLGYECRDGGLGFSVSTHIVSTGIPLQKFGSPELKARYLPAIVDGSAVGAHAITERGGGSDVIGTTTVAEAAGDHFVINGAKTFITNGPIADVFCVYARTDPDRGAFGLTAFVVERDTPGLTVGAAMEKMGLRTSPLCELTFEDCRIPVKNVVGRRNTGFLVFDHVMKWEILCSFSVVLGRMRRRLERCIERARTRTQFGQPIGSFQLVATKLVDMKIATETTAKWLYDTAEGVMRGAATAEDLAIAKLTASEADVATAMDAVQIFGGAGYLTATGLEKDVRDAIAGTIYSGTSEIQRVRIAKLLGL